MRVRRVALFFASCTLALGVQPSLVHASALFSQVDGMPGVAAGEDSHFQIADSDYLNITLDSSEIIRLRIESVPNVITMRLEPVSASATSTQITMTGLAPDTAYFKYEDNYHNLTPITSDENGSFSYAQDLSRPHLVFIQPKKSTKFISNDATGGDCATIGTWDPATLTCTLTTDLTETVEIDSDSVTLDGGGHSTTGSDTGNGVYLDARSGVTIRNMRIENFSYGVNLNNSSNNHIEDNIFANDDNQAIVLSSSNANTISGNTVSLPVPSASRHQGFVLYGSHENTFQNNTISLNVLAGTGRHQGILLFDSNRNSLDSNAVSDTYQGILLFGSHDNVLRGNAVQGSVKEGVTIYTPTSGNQVYHNNFIGNGAKAVDYGGAADVFSLSEPDGGNYWDVFDDPAEGCDDANLDGFCDAAYAFTGGQDALPWTRQDGWKSPPEPRPSNILFLPGIEGSRLYEGTSCGKAAEEKLWEPFDSAWSAVRGVGDGKVRDLSLDQTGESVCPDIYVKVGDIIDAVHGSNIYASFMSEMDGLKADGTIADWEPVAYDWRLSLDDLLAKGAERDGKIYYEEATGTPYIKQTLRALAASSKSGKVSIVAHSNGGLVAKALLNQLGSEASKLVDKVIMVGAPQSGAPEDLGATLLGYNAGIYKYGFPILSNAAARTLAQNSPMAYHLLPSEDYLESTAGDVAHPVVRFSGSGYAKEEAAYGTTIANRTALDNFLLAKEGGRTKPKPSDTNSAEILNPTLIGYANSTHAALDFWTPPAGIEVDQIAGWGADTVAGVDFYTEPPRVSWLFGPKRSYRPTFIEDGDGTVPVPSALQMASSTGVKRYWLDLAKINNVPGVKVKRGHKDLFEISSLEDFIKNIITNSTSTLPAYISLDQPPPATGTKRLIFFLHTSPVLQASTTPEVEIPPPPKVTLRVKHSSTNKATGISGDDSITEDIPDSTYGEFGDVKYIIIPESDRYELVLSGQSDSGGAGGWQGGTFTLDIQESSGGIVVASTTIADVPVTASTTASLAVSGGLDSSSPLTVDENGDGTNIITIIPVIGEAVNYEPPPESPPEPIPVSEPEPEPASAPVGRAAGGPGYSPYTPLIAIATPEVIATTAPSVASSTATTTTGNSITPVSRRVATIPRVARRSLAQASPAVVANTFPDLSQTASAYGASQQSIVKRLGAAVYNGLYGLWSALKRLL